MKNLFISVSLLTAMILSGSASYGQTKETRSVKDFTKVSFGVAGNLFVKIGPQFNLVIEGDKNILEKIETEVSGGRLIIKKENWKMSFNDEKVTVNLTLPELEGLSVSGSGKAQIMDPVEADNLGLAVSGSGKLITSNLNVDNLDCGISGSGDIILGSGGSIDNGDISISGSGSFSGEGIEIDNLDISVSGSGNCICRVGDSLEASVSGSGNVTYIGNPKVDSRVSGSGHVRSR